MNSPALRICSFESRRSQEMSDLIRKHGGIPTVAPSMRELPLEDSPQALDFANRLFRGEIDIIIFMTGVGARALLEALTPQFEQEKLFAEFNKRIIVVRGPKPTAVLHGWKVRMDYRVPEPNTWREMLTTLDRAQEQSPEPLLKGKLVAVQEYGVPNQEFYTELESRGAKVLPVPVYRWGLPEDLRPLQDAIELTIQGNFHALMFTSAQQIRNVLQVADNQGKGEAFREATRNCRIASIGPTCTEALEAEGLHVDLEASPPKMAPLVKQTLGKT